MPGVFKEEKGQRSRKTVSKVAEKGRGQCGCL